jgi:hypothetical protein
VVRNGWADIGYHAGIEIAGSALECFYGRPATEMGAHCKGFNSGSLGFCFVGNFDNEAPSDMLLYVAAERVILPWMVQFGIDIDAVFCHRAFAPDRTCPGELFDIEELKGMLRPMIRAATRRS